MTTTAPERFVTTTKMAEILGVARQTVRDWADAGIVPAYRGGSHRKFLVSEVLDALRQRGLAAGGEESPTASKP